MTRPSRSITRVALAAVCSLALALPAHARDPVPEAPAGPMTDELPPRAQEHVVKALQQFQNSAYFDAEASFKRASFFAPNWRPLHFNLGVVAEAQGKLGTAIKEYKAFKPYATLDEGMLVDQRISELNDRHKRIAGAYKRQIAASAIAMSLGVGMLAGGGVLIGLGLQKKKAADNADTNNPAAATDTSYTKYLSGAYILVVVGALAVAYAFIPLSKSLKSKRQLEGLAVGKTRLQWTGGAGVRLRF